MMRILPGLVALLYLVATIALTRGAWLLSPVAGWLMLGLELLLAAGALEMHRRRQAALHAYEGRRTSPDGSPVLMAHSRSAAIGHAEPLEDLDGAPRWRLHLYPRAGDLQ